MPPLKKFTFTDDLDSGIVIEIEARGLEQAMNLLIKTVKHPADFFIKEPSAN